MDTIQRAHRVILDAEQKLQGLIEEAVKQQRYEDVSKLAEILGVFVNIINVSASSAAATSKTTATAVSAPRQKRTSEGTSNASIGISEKRVPVKRPNSKTEASKYPRFAKDLDRLVKVGWSKKNKGEYEHRVPKAAVEAFVSHLRTFLDISGKEVWEMEDVSPVLMGDEEEVPAYQTYVALAWLRQTGTIQKKGRDGYTVQKRQDLENLNELWEGLPVRGASEEVK